MPMTATSPMSVTPSGTASTMSNGTILNGTNPETVTISLIFNFFVYSDNDYCYGKHHQARKRHSNNTSRPSIERYNSNSYNNYNG